MQKISTFLWYDTQAEEAANFYAELFAGKIGHVSRYGEHGPMPAGTAMVVAFELFGQDFKAMNGGPMFKFNESVSFVVDCADQAEVDRYWNALTADGGAESQCGWCKDRFGLSWQIIPRFLTEVMSSNDPARTGRVMGAMMQMGKIDIAKLEAAAG